MPRAVRQAVSKLRPDFVAVELDKSRGAKYLDRLPPSLWGRAAMVLPADEAQAVLAKPTTELQIDDGLMQGIKEKLRDAPASHEAFLQATRDIFARSSDNSLAMNVFALHEFRQRCAGDWGRDAMAAVEAAAKAGKPLLFCDFPQEWTLGKVVPVYNRAWVEARQQQLDYLSDLSRALRALSAEEKILAECVVSGRGGDLPILGYGLGLCRPAVGPAEAEARTLWLAERDPAIAAAVEAAMEGRARSASGGPASLQAARRALLVVGCNHVEGVAQHLMGAHGYEAAPEPAGGWPGSGRGTTLGSSTRGGASRRRPPSFGKRRASSRSGRRVHD